MRVLVVEDDASLSEIVCAFLSREGFSCTPAFSGSEAQMLLERAAAGAQAVEGGPVSFDVVITDLMLPGLPGEELVSIVRRAIGEVPVIVTSAKDAVADRVELLRTGADDYLVKPFDLDELLARINVQLRLRGIFPGEGLGAGDWSEAASGGSIRALAYGAWRLDPVSRAFLVDGERIRLTRTEFGIVEALMRQPGRVFTKRDLYLSVCQEGAVPSDASVGIVTASDEKTVSTHVGNLRAKLKGSGTEGYIETVWGIGFRLRDL